MEIHVSRKMGSSRENGLRRMGERVVQDAAYLRFSRTPYDALRQDRKATRGSFSAHSQGRQMEGKTGTSLALGEFILKRKCARYAAQLTLKGSCAPVIKEKILFRTVLRPLNTLFRAERDVPPRAVEIRRRGLAHLFFFFDAVMRSVITVIYRQ